ncbi:MAG: hypothetical protein H0U16_01790 [Actinobacteria bacterium]|nr:hypothetical protein [Actinomycetota bacterium]
MKYVVPIVLGAVVGAVILVPLIWASAALMVAYSSSSSLDAIPFYPPTVGGSLGAVLGALAAVCWSTRKMRE